MVRLAAEAFIVVLLMIFFWVLRHKTIIRNGSLILLISIVLLSLLIPLWNFLFPGLFVAIMGAVAGIMTATDWPRTKPQRVLCIAIFTLLAVLEITLLKREQNIGAGHYSNILLHFQTVETDLVAVSDQETKNYTNYANAAKQQPVIQVDPTWLKASALSVDILRFLLQRAVAAPTDPSLVSTYNQQTLNLYSHRFAGRATALQKEAALRGISIPEVSIQPTTINDVRGIAQAIGDAPVNPYAGWSNDKLRDYSVDFIAKLRELATELFQDIGRAEQPPRFRESLSPKILQEIERDKQEVLKKDKNDINVAYERLNPEASGLRNELLRRLRIQGPTPEPAILNGGRIDTTNDIVDVMKYLQGLVDSLGRS